MSTAEAASPLKRFIVTGAVGHIGSYLVRDLSSQFPGVEVVMIDNLMTQRFASLFNLPQRGSYRFVEADVTTADLRPYIEEADCVIHLAAITDAAGSLGRAAEVEANNLQGTARVARTCANAGTRFITISSTSVYGSQNEVVSEDCSIGELKPQSPYAATKLKEEALVSQLVAEHGLPAVIFRFGTIFGTSPGMRFHTAVNKFCWQAVMGQPITVWTTAYDQKRQYLDLRDASRAITFAISQDLFDGRIYNVLTQNATVRAIVDIVRECVPDIRVQFADSPIMNQLSYEVSSERFSSKGFHFVGDLRSGIGETVALLRQANGSGYTALKPLLGKS